MRSFGPDTVFAVYTYDEGPRETVGSRHDLEEGVYGIGLGVLSHCIDSLGFAQTEPDHIFPLGFFMPFILNHFLPCRVICKSII